MQVADGERLRHIALPAMLFAQPRAYPPQRGGQGKPVGHQARRGGVITGRNAGDEPGDVQPRRAAGMTRGHTIARVVGKQQFQRGLAGGPDLRRIRDHRHSGGNRRGAGRPKIGASFDLHRAQKAGSGRLEALDVAEGWDGDAQLARGAQNRGARRHGHRPPINVDGDGAHTISTAP